MLTPGEQWRWDYCTERDRLLLDISNELQFCSPFPAKRLCQQPAAQPVSMAEAETYWSLWQNIQSLPFHKNECLELTLTALAASCFLQLQAHKSWYFSMMPAASIELYDIVLLNGENAASAIIIQQDPDCVSCMLLETITTLAGKVLPRCSVVRVLRNRVSPMPLNHELARSA